MAPLLTTTAAFVAVALTGGLWIGFAQRLGPGGPGMPFAVLGGAFSVAFLWLLFIRLRRLLAHPERRWLEMLLLALNMALLIFVYAWIHHRIGILDRSGAISRPSHDLGDALYFSVITLTTVGYGDFIPIGAGRIIAAMQGMIGYVILGIMVSTGFQLLAPSRSAGEQEEGSGRSDQDESEPEQPEQPEQPGDRGGGAG